SISWMARIVLRSTLTRAASAGSDSACRSAGETARPCRITRPSEVRKIDSATLSSLSCHTSSTRNFKFISALSELSRVHRDQRQATSPDLVREFLVLEDGNGGR